MNNRLKIIGIAVLTIIIILVGILFLSNLKPVEKTPPIQPVPTSYVILTPTSTPAPVTLETKEALIQLLPVEKDSFLIEYLYASDRFIVTITKSPFEINKKGAENWFKNQGISDFSKLDITYTKYGFVQ